MKKKLKEKLKFADVRLVVFDSDGVLIPRGTEVKSTQKRNGNYEQLFSTAIVSDRVAEKINKLKKKCIVCICSGRGMVYLQEMYNKVLGGSTILSAENGALFFISDYIENCTRLGEGYIDKLRKIREEVKDLNIKGFEPKQFILTVHCEKELKEVYEIVEKYDIEGELKVMWNGEAFDIQKKSLSKGLAMEILMKEMRFRKDQVVAIGDRINDKELIEVAGIGVSADKRKLDAEYYLDKGNNGELPGEVLLDLLLKKFEI